MRIEEDTQSDVGSDDSGALFSRLAVDAYEEDKRRQNEERLRHQQEERERMERLHANTLEEFASHPLFDWVAGLSSDMMAVVAIVSSSNTPYIVVYPPREPHVRLALFRQWESKTPLALIDFNAESPNWLRNAHYCNSWVELGRVIASGYHLAREEVDVPE